MGIEIIKDHNGKNYIALSNEKFFNDDAIGDNIENFEILEILGNYNKGTTFSAKVRSLINHKLYFMKKIGQNLSIGERSNLINILDSIKKIGHQNIVNQIKNIFQNDSFYIFEEFLNNRDLQDYMKTFDDLERPIEEPTLWNIFLQCASGLKSIHNHNIIHRNISLSNLIMNEKKVVKLGNFKYSAFCNEGQKRNEKISAGMLTQSPEMINGLEYGKKTDIFSLGIVFFKLCFFEYPFNLSKDEKGFVFVPKEIKRNNNIYSKEMKDIIDSMLKLDENERPDSNELYNMILKEYVKNLENNTSIESVFRCINSYKDLSMFMKQNKDTFKNEEITPVSFNFTNCIDNFMVNKEKSNCALYLNNFRNLLYKNIQIDNDKEIKPILVLDYLLEKLNKETGNNFKGQSFGIQPINWGKKKKSFETYKQYFNENYNSIISRNFVGFLKTKRICQLNSDDKKKCQWYSYSLYPYVEFNLDNCMKKKDNSENEYEYEPNVENWFGLQFNHDKILSLDHNVFCKKCNRITTHVEFKQFEPENFPKNLIISIYRGDEYKNKSKIDYPLKLTSGKFELVGVIKRMIDDKGEYFASIYLDPDNNKWMLCERSSIKEVSDHNALEEGLVVMLFYRKYAQIED